MAPIAADPTACAGWSAFGSGSSQRAASRGKGEAVAAVDARTRPMAGRSRTAAPQGAVVGSALEELGARPSLRGAGGQLSSRHQAMARRSDD